MGKIIVGQKSPKTVDMGGFTVAQTTNVATNENKNGMTAEEKARIVKNIMALPKDQIVPALRKNGFNDIADITEAEMKKEAEEEVQANARKNRLAEIMSMPVEEQLPLLLAEGFTEEAQKLSNHLAEENGDGKTSEEGGIDTDSEKKKVGRPKKSEE